MEESLEGLLDKFDRNGKCSCESIALVEEHFRCTLPPTYKKFMQLADGGEGVISDQYLILWSISELVAFNRDYEVTRLAPGLLLFGSNGVGEAFAFDCRSAEKMVIRMVPVIGMSMACATHIADDFAGFMSHLAGVDRLEVQERQ